MTALDTTDPDAQAILRYGVPAVRIAATADRATVRASMLLEARYTPEQVADELAAWVAAHPEQAAREARGLEHRRWYLIPTDACGL